jgi:hypothetical protein
MGTIEPGVAAGGDTDWFEPATLTALGNHAQVHQVTGTVRGPAAAGARPRRGLGCGLPRYVHDRSPIEVARHVAKRRARFTQDTDNGGITG